MTDWASDLQSSAIRVGSSHRRRPGRMIERTSGGGVRLFVVGAGAVYSGQLLSSEKVVG